MVVKVVSLRILKSFTKPVAYSMSSVASKVPFSDLCLVCEKISSKHGNDNKKKVLSDFIKTWREFHNKIHRRDNRTTTDSFYPAMQLLLPQFDRERGPYGIKENTLAKLYIEILNLNKESTGAQKLLNYRLPANMKDDVRDFAMVAYFVLKNRCPETGSLKISDVTADLDGIATCNAAKNKDGVKRHLLHLLRNTSAMEQKWLIRMILKEMKFGLSEQSVLNTFHLDAKDLYDVTNSLVKVCLTLRDPNLRSNEIDISMFAPFRPMLAERAPPNKVQKLMNHKPFYIETKHDGERMQLHKQGDQFKYYSRGGNEYTHNYGSDPSSGTLTPYIASAFIGDVRSCILDGEMMGYNVRDQYTGTKADNFDVKCLRDGDDYQPCYHVFDILLLNDKVLSNLPLKQRLTYLGGLFTPVKGRLQFPPRTEGNTSQDVVDALNTAIDNREEGIVVKNPDSVYKPNTRKGGWIKIKPEYVDGLMDELDLVIVGGYFGTGHRKGMLSHFLLAVAVDPDHKDEQPSVFHSVCRVGSGYTMQELRELCCKLENHLKPYDGRNPPKSIILAQGHKEKPDLCIEPSKSFIVQVKAAEIVDSDKFKTGCTLRFPRVEKVRYDKPWHQCMTVSDLREMRELASGKLASKHVLNDTAGDDQSPKKRRRTAASKLGQAVAVASHFRGIDASLIEKDSNLFRNKEFYVANYGAQNTSKKELERLIVKHGGDVVQNPRVGTVCTLADHESVRVKNVIKADIYDVVGCDWLLRCIDRQQILEWAPSDMLHASPMTQSLLSRNYDDFGDSYTNDVTPLVLKTIFSNMETRVTMNAEEMAEIETEHFPNSSPLGLFRTCIIYVDMYETVGKEETKLVGSALDVTALCLRFYGASLSRDLDGTVTHVVLESTKGDRVDQFREVNRQTERKFHLVTEKWVSKSIERGALTEERRFAP